MGTDAKRAYRGRNLTAFSRGILESKAIEILSKQAKEKQSAAGGDKKSEEYKKTALCEFTQSDKRKEMPKSEPKIDVKKELAKRIGTGEQTASIDFSAKIRYNIYVSNLCHNGTYPIYVKKG